MRLLHRSKGTMLAVLSFAFFVLSAKENASRTVQAELL